AAFQDPVTTLLEQTDAFEVQFGNRGGALTTNRGSNAIHDWTTLDENAALNWLAQFELQDPAAYTTHNLLADRSARWHAFYLAQTEPGRFTPFSYQFQPGQNRVYTIAQGNLSRISFYPSTLALRTSDPLEWVIANTEVEPIDMVLYGVNAMPIDVERNGQSVVNWAYDPVLRQLTLKENDATSVPTWRIYF
ncbi:MAG: hypothetical protein R3E96_16245, partial [Planctomycetota bacterium]